MTESFKGSILAVDFGNVHTRVVLVDLVEGTYKPVAYGEVRTTGGFPQGDVSIGMMRAIRQISRATGRELLNATGSVITPETAERTGVDTFLITTSIGRPLRTVLIGLTEDLSVASGLRAVAGTYIQVVETLTLEDDRDENQQLNAIVLSRPDLIFIVGGMEGGAQETVMRLARRASLALRLMRDGKQRVVLFAGNSQAGNEIRDLFAGAADVLYAENVRPRATSENPAPASAQLASAYDLIAEERGAGFAKAAENSTTGVMPTAQSYSLITRYLGKTTGSALSLDVGSGVSTLSAAIGEQTTTTIRNDIGLGHSARSLLDATGLQAVQRWLPFLVDDNELLAYALNKTLRPGTLPENERELYLEHAFMRAGVQAMVQTARPLWTKQTSIDPDAPLPDFHTIIGAGAVFANTGRPGMAALLLLDALQPTGVSDLLLDNNALIPALGALARVQPEAFVQLLDAGGIMSLGKCLTVQGSPRAGKNALRVRITLPDGGVVKQEVAGGSLWMYPLPLGVRALIDVRVVGRGISIGGKRKVRMEVTGGTAGFIIDARGRPLPLASTPAERAQQLPAWYAQATGDTLRPIKAEWLEKLVRESDPPADMREIIEKREPAAKPVSRGSEEVKQAEANRLRDRFRQTGPLNAQDDGASPPPPARKEEDIDELRNLFS
jgi:hypothetical protein